LKTWISGDRLIDSHDDSFRKKEHCGGMWWCNRPPHPSYLNHRHRHVASNLALEPVQVHLLSHAYFAFRVERQRRVSSGTSDKEISHIKNQSAEVVVVAVGGHTQPDTQELRTGHVTTSRADPERTGNGTGGFVDNPNVADQIVTVRSRPRNSRTSGKGGWIQDIGCKCSSQRNRPETDNFVLCDITPLCCLSNA
jgi:hypothetical protein